MPEAKIRFFLHNVAVANGHRVIYLAVGVSEKRPVRQATGYAAHPAYFNAKVPHLLERAVLDGFHKLGATPAPDAPTG